MGSSSQHFYDASYEVWRNGGNPDRVDRDRSDNDFYDGRTPDYTAGRELRQMRDARERRFQQEAEEEYWSQQPEPEYPEQDSPSSPEQKQSTDDLPF
jgi:hypothetical protein